MYCILYYRNASRNELCYIVDQTICVFGYPDSYVFYLTILKLLGLFQVVLWVGGKLNPKESGKTPDLEEAEAADGFLQRLAVPA